MIEDFYTETNEKAIEMIGAAFSFLYLSGKENGSWEDLRGTALAGVALDLKEPPNSIWIKAIRNNIIFSQITHSESAGSWNEEIWDTSLAILALKTFETSSRDEVIKNAVGWISNLYKLNNRNNWHDEPWETSWALIAILTTGIIPNNLRVEEAISWLLEFQEDNGKIIAPHYTGYYLFIYSLLKKFPVEKDYSIKFESAKDKALIYLKEELNKTNDILWTGEAWSNGQILWAISEVDANFHRDAMSVEKVVKWFELNQSKSGNWSDTEDTASAIIGLFKMLENIYTENNINDRKSLKNLIQKRLPTFDINVRRPLIEKHPETGGISIHLNSTLLKRVAIIGAIVATVSSVLTIYDFLGKLFQ